LHSTAPLFNSRRSEFKAHQPASFSVLILIWVPKYSRNDVPQIPPHPGPRLIGSARLGIRDPPVLGTRSMHCWVASGTPSRRAARQIQPTRRHRWSILRQAA
jgi:hypothetical protein